MAFKITAPEEPTAEVPSRIGKALKESYRELGEPTDELTDEQIDRALKGYMGIGGQTAKDYLLDFFEVAPMVMGMPLGITAVGAAKLFKPLAKEFRALTRPGKDFAKSLEKGYSAEALSETVKQQLAVQRKTYRGLIKGLRNIPQETAELVESVGLHARKSGGSYYPIEKRIVVGPQTPKPIETIGHEFEHAKTVTARMAAQLPITQAEAALFEGTAYEFGEIFGREVAKLPKGQKITSEMFDELYERAGKRARLRWGKDPTKWKKEDIVAASKERRLLKREKEQLTELRMEEGKGHLKLVKKPTTPQGEWTMQIFMRDGSIFTGRQKAGTWEEAFGKLKERARKLGDITADFPGESKTVHLMKLRTKITGD